MNKPKRTRQDERMNGEKHVIISFFIYVSLLPSLFENLLWLSDVCSEGKNHDWLSSSKDGTWESHLSHSDCFYQAISAYLRSRSATLSKPKHPLPHSCDLFSRHKHISVYSETYVPLRPNICFTIVRSSKECISCPFVLRNIALQAKKRHPSSLGFHPYSLGMLPFKLRVSFK